MHGSDEGRNPQKGGKVAGDLPRISNSEFRDRWERLQVVMADAGLDMVIAYADDHAVFGPAHARYLVDFAPHFEPVCVLVPAAGEPLLLSGPETETFAQLTARVEDVRVIREFTHPDEEYPFTALVSLLDVVDEATARAGQTPSRVGLAGLELMPFRIHAALGQALPGVELVDAENALTNLRAIKTPAEQAVIRYAYQIAQAGMQAAFDATHEGASEREVAAAAEYTMRSMGSEGMGIDTIVASGPNTRPILARTRLRELRRDELILLTIAPRYEGYHAAIGRPLVIGQPQEDVSRAMEVAASAQKAASQAMHPGMAGSEVEGAARRIVESAGLGEYFLYCGVHSVGVIEFEPPIFGPTNHDPLQAGMVLSIDVPLFHTPWGGLRFEDGYLITDSGVELLGDFPTGILTV
jgi:Xaa-Pro aminopeptidase